MKFYARDSDPQHQKCIWKMYWGFYINFLLLSVLGDWKRNCFLSLLDGTLSIFIIISNLLIMLMLSISLINVLLLDPSIFKRDMLKSPLWWYIYEFQEFPGGLVVGGAFTSMARVQSLVQELRSHQLYSMAK